MPPRKAPDEIKFTQSKNWEPPSSWQSTGDLLSPKRKPTPLERQAIAEVHELAARLAAGTTTTDEIRAATTGKQRWLATLFTPPKDPLFKPLMAMFDALIADQGRFKTKHGSFTQEELRETEAKITREDGREKVEFPVAYPWSVKPDPVKGTGGIRKPAVFREKRGPTEGRFSVNPPTTEKPYEPEWWEAESSEDVPF